MSIELIAPVVSSLPEVVSLVHVNSSRMTIGSFTSPSFKYRILPELRRQRWESKGDVKIFRLSHHLRYIIIFSPHRIRQIRYNHCVIGKHHVDQRFPTLRPQVACENNKCVSFVRLSLFWFSRSIKSSVIILDVLKMSQDILDTFGMILDRERKSTHLTDEQVSVGTCRQRQDTVSRVEISRRHEEGDTTAWHVDTSPRRHSPSPGFRILPSNTFRYPHSLV